MSTTNSSPLSGLTREQAYIAGLRELAGFLEENPQLVPLSSNGEYFCRYARSREELTKMVRHRSKARDLGVEIEVTS